MNQIKSSKCLRRGDVSFYSRDGSFSCEYSKSHRLPWPSAKPPIEFVNNTLPITLSSLRPTVQRPLFPAGGQGFSSR